MRRLVSDTLVIAERNLIRLPRSPDLLLAFTVQPIMFVLLFVYVFGGAINTPGYSYVDFLIPGIIVQNIAFGGFVTALGLNEDLHKGLIDRFRSLPMARPAVLAGRTLADVVTNTLSVIVLVITGLIIGFSFGTSAGEVLAGFGILLLFGYAFSWVFALLGLLVNSPESANSLGFIAVFPLTFISSAFVPVDSMPAALQWFADINPFTIVVDAMRALWLGAPAGNSIWGAVGVVDRDPRRLRAAGGAALPQDGRHALSGGRRLATIRGVRSRRPRLRTLAVVAAALIGAGVLAVAAANAVVLLGGDGSSDVAGAPHAQVALLLGAKVEPSGRPSAMLRDRIAIAAQLYRDGKVERVLASGDHGTTDYDEVNAMKRELVARGVPERDVFTDHAGFDTWSSVVRARKVFRVSSVLVVTQRFHLARAVWLARRAGLTAHGVDADLHGYGRQGKLSQVREVLARVKAVGEVATGAQPRYLGPAIPITGDASASAG